MTNPEKFQPNLEDNKRQAALTLVQQYHSSGRGLDALKRDAAQALKSNTLRFRGWMVETYQRAVELWDEAEISKITSGPNFLPLVHHPEKPKPKTKPTFPQPREPLPATPLGKISTKPAPKSEDIFAARRRKAIEKELSGELDLGGRENFPVEVFFTDTSEIVVTERTPGVFGQYYQHPLNRSPKVFREDKAPRVSRKFKK